MTQLPCSPLRVDRAVTGSERHCARVRGRPETQCSSQLKLLTQVQNGRREEMAFPPSKWSVIMATSSSAVYRLGDTLRHPLLDLVEADVAGPESNEVRQSVHPASKCLPSFRDN